MRQQQQVVRGRDASSHVGASASHDMQQNFHKKNRLSYNFLGVFRFKKTPVNVFSGLRSLQYWSPPVYVCVFVVPRSLPHSIFVYIPRVLFTQLPPTESRNDSAAVLYRTRDFFYILS